MTGRARYWLPDATGGLRVVVAVWSAIAVAAAVVAMWFFANRRPVFGVAWLVLAVGWALVALGACRIWAARSAERPISAPPGGLPRRSI